MNLGNQGILSGAFEADSELEDHYRGWQPTYLFWAAKLCSFTLPLPRGDVLEYDEYETVNELANWIRKGDRPLGKHMQLPGTRRKIALSHVTICELFVMNIVAKEPVKVT